MDLVTNRILIFLVIIAAVFAACTHSEAERPEEINTIGGEEAVSMLVNSEMIIVNGERVRDVDRAIFVEYYQDLDRFIMTDFEDGKVVKDLTLGRMNVIKPDDTFEEGGIEATYEDRFGQRGVLSMLEREGLMFLFFSKTSGGIPIEGFVANI